MAKQKRRADGRLQRHFRVNRKNFTVYGKTAEELREKEYLKRQELASGIEKHDNPTLDEYYLSWTEARRGSIKESTLHKQLCQYKVCSDVIIPGVNMRLGDLKLREITVEDLRIVQRTLYEEGRRTVSVNGTLSHLSHVFNTALKERRIDFNPGTLIQPLKRVEERARDTTHRALTLEETEAFFAEAEARHSCYLNVYRIALCTGMRIGEIGALLPQDVKNGRISVNKTLTRTEVGNYVIGQEAKTESGKRTIPMNDDIRSIIQEQKRLNALIDNGIVAIDRPIFRAAEGGLLMSTPVNREIKRICQKAGIKPFTAHAFRDTFATRCIEAGINPRTVQELLGHADFNLTMNLYGHVMDKTKEAAMNTINVGLKAI